jgi:hypothetical protein
MMQAASPTSIDTAKFRSNLNTSSPLALPTSHRRLSSLQWFFRPSSTSRRRRSLLPIDLHKRNFYGMGEIIGVLTSVSSALRLLHPSLIVHRYSWVYTLFYSLWIPSAPSPSLVVCWRTLGERLTRAGNARRYVLDIPFLVCRDSSHEELRLRLLKRHSEASRASQCFLARAPSEKYVAYSSR